MNATFGFCTRGWKVSEILWVHLSARKGGFLGELGDMNDTAWSLAVRRPFAIEAIEAIEAICIIRQS